MNADRRKRIAELRGQLESIVSQIETLGEEERGAYDGLPEGLQSAPNGEKMEAAATALETAAEQVQEAIDSLNEAAE
ncbi:MAG TPA: hypothetical protein VF427_15665 [Noviherbaspirillum sp.]